MNSILLGLLVAFAASFCAIKLFKPIAYRIGLVDIPNSRKLHTGEVPLVGGIAVFIGVLTSCAVLYPQGNVLNLYLIASGLIVFLGALDDYKDLSVGARLMAQILISSIMVYGADVHLMNFGNILGWGDIHLGWLGYPLTILAIIASINAFNMTDGIDGLAGTLSLIAFLSLAFLMLLSPGEFATLPLLLAFAMLPYLAFNLGFAGGVTKKIFMGDAGSMFVGLSVVWLLVQGSQGESTAFKPVTALWIIAIPFWDMCAITIRRIAQGRSPFRPDREHLHHIFLRMGFSSNRALLIISTMSLLLSAVGIVGELKDIPESFMFGLFMLGFATYYYALKHIWKLTKIVKAKTTKKITKEGATE